MPASIDLNELVSAAGDAIVVCDKAGAITLWNAAAERIFGFSAAEAIGQSLDIIIPERMRNRHWEGYHVSMETGVTRYGTEVLRVPAIDKQGRQLSISFTVTMLSSGADKPHSIAALMRDETRAFAQSRELKKRIAELEAELKSRGGSIATADAAAPPSPDPASPHEDEPTSGCPVKHA